MPIGSNNPFRESIKTALAQRAGRADANAIVETTAAAWRLVAEQLAPVIGTRGLEVLFRRALHMTRPAFPWLAAGRDGDHAGPLPGIAGCFAGQDAAAAAEASYMLLLTFTELLTTLIGESLTTRLLAPVWASPSLPSIRNPPHER